jgi:methionyl-tRNA formyltransferase
VPPGEVIRTGKQGIEVACGAGSALRITELQPEGKKRMPASAFLAGHPLAAGTRFA